MYDSAPLSGHDKTDDKRDDGFSGESTRVGLGYWVQHPRPLQPLSKSCVGQSMSLCLVPT